MADEPPTPESIYLDRRKLLVRGGIVAASALTTGALYRLLNAVGGEKTDTKAITGVVTGAFVSGCS